MKLARCVAVALFVVGATFGCKSTSSSGTEASEMCATCATAGCSCAHCGGDENAACTCKK